MRNSEAKFQERTDEFVRAAQDLHDEGMDWLYVSDINEQMARNDPARMRRHKIASKIFGLFGVELKPPQKASGATYPITARLEHDGVLKSTWEAGVLQAPDRPQRRLYRLAEIPEPESVLASESV